METLSDDLNAMVKAKEITLPQALELNKQKKTAEEHMINLWEDDKNYDKTAIADMLQLGSGFYWGGNKVVVTGTGRKRRPGHQVTLFASEDKIGGEWFLIFAANCNGFLKKKNSKIKQIMPTHPLQPGYNGNTISGLVKMYGSDVDESEDVIGMKMYYCSLQESKPVYHFSIRDKKSIKKIDRIMSKVINDDDSDFVNEMGMVLKELEGGEKTYVPLTGHTATSIDKLAETVDEEGFSATKANKKTCAAFHIWVQFENNAVSSRYINTASGPMVKSATPIYETRGPKGSLKVLHQPSIDEHTLQQMVMPADFSMEMQKLMISELPEISGKNGGKTKQACFLCNGTGRREVAEKFVYGDNAINEEKERIKNSVEASSSNIAVAIKEEEYIPPHPPLRPGHLGYVPPPSPSRKSPKEERKTLEKRKKEYGVGISINIYNMDSILKKQFTTEVERFDKCFVCMGTGLVSKMREALVIEEDDNNANVEECLICWALPQKYGISTECTHFFCEECIKYQLKTVMNSGKFPGYCPVCKASAPKGEDPRYGKIDGDAMSFLEKQGIIDKEFQFQFMRKQEEFEELFFECPAKCGNYLVDVDPTYVLRKDKVVARVERCPCGQGVCVQCHQAVKDEDFETHCCPEVGKKGKQLQQLQDDQATLALMKKLGKKCTNCNMFIMKNAGCDVMMCGDKAHGDLRKAIRNGGCGLTFMWSSMKHIEDTITNLNGQRVRCNPIVKYKNEIAAYKRKLGIALSEEDNKLADLVSGNILKKTKGNGQLVNGRELFWACKNNNFNKVFEILSREYEEDETLRQNIDVDFRMPENELGWTGREVTHWSWLVAWFIPWVIPWVILCGKKWFHFNNAMLWKYVCLTLLAWYFHPSLGNLGRATPIFTIPFYTAACEAFVLSLVGQYNTPLTCAIFNGNTKIVKLLLLHDADKTYRATSGMSPLNAACFHGHSEIGAILINKSPGLVDQRHHIGKKPDRCCTPMANAARCCNKPLHWKRSDTIGLSLYCGLIVGLPIFIALIIFFSMVGESL